MAPQLISYSNGNGTLGDTLSTGLPPSTADGNLQLMFTRKRGSDGPSAAGAWGASHAYAFSDVVQDPSGGPLWQLRRFLQHSLCDNTDHINTGHRPPGDPDVCFTDYWWKKHPVINNDPSYGGWSPVTVGVGYGIFSNVSGNGKSAAATVDYGTLNYDQDIFLLEFSDAAIINAFAGSVTGSSLTVSEDGIGVTVPFWSSASWLWFMVELEGGDGVKAMVLFITPTSTIGWTTPSSGFPPTGWSAIPGAYSVVLVNSAPLLYAPQSDVVTDICERAGLVQSQIDVSLLTNSNIKPNVTVKGYLVEQPRSAAEILKVLMQSYFFDGCESGGKMRWIPRGMASAISIPESDLGLLDDKAKLEETLAQAQDLPIEITVIHNDPVLDYQQNKQLKRRNTRVVGSTLQNITLQIPMTMDATWARQVAEKALYLAWLERSSYKMNLWKALYMMLDPTDVVTFTYEGVTFTMRLTDNTIGQGFVIELQGVSDNANNYVSSAQGGAVQGYTTVPAPIVAQTQLWLFDLNLLEDTDSNPGGTGFYFAGGSVLPDWAGMVLYSSSDNSAFSDLADDSNAASFGFATTTLSAPRSPWEWDSANMLTVKLSVGSFSGDTQLNVLNGTNRILVGNPSTGVFEIIGFQNAVQNSDGTWTISELLRGLRGTEGACASHGSSELVMVIDSGVQRQAEPLSVIGVPEYYKAVTVGQDPSTVGAQQLAVAGADLKPYAPCQIGGTVDGSGNITVTWLRRTRIGGEADWADGVADVPLSEDSELYDVDVLNGSSIVRTFSNVPVNSVVYTAAQQTTDFGSPQAHVTVNAYQKSGQVGRGFKGVGVAPTLGGWPVPVPASSGAASGSGQFYVNGS